jgi:hypothetical protein
LKEEAGEETKHHSTECPGSATSPKAEKGFLCLYTENPNYKESEVGWVLEPTSEAHPFGAVLIAANSEPGAFFYGSWAVTAP